MSPGNQLVSVQLTLNKTCLHFFPCSRLVNSPFHHNNFTYLSGWAGLSPPVPKSTHLQLIQGQFSPPGISFKSRVCSSAPRHFVLSLKCGNVGCWNISFCSGPPWTAWYAGLLQVRPCSRGLLCPSGLLVFAFVILVLSLFRFFLQLEYFEFFVVFPNKRILFY